MSTSIKFLYMFFALVSFLGRDGAKFEVWLSQLKVVYKQYGQMIERCYSAHHLPSSGRNGHTLLCLTN